MRWDAIDHSIGPVLELAREHRFAVTINAQFMNLLLSSVPSFVVPESYEGLEQEWTLVLRSFPRSWDKYRVKDLFDEIRKAAQERLGVSLNLDEFQLNGGRHYVDGNNLETATPPIKRVAALNGAQEIALYIAADDTQLARLAAYISAKLSHRHRARIEVSISKVAARRNGNTRGCHENYSVDSRPPIALVANCLPPFLVARGLLTERGSVIPDRTKGWSFVRSAKAKWTTKAGIHKLVQINDFNRGDPKRIEIKLHGPNHSQTINALKFGMTRLVIDYVREQLKAHGRQAIGNQIPELDHCAAEYAFGLLNSSNPDAVVPVKFREVVRQLNSAEILGIYRSLVTAKTLSDEWVLSTWDRLTAHLLDGTGVGQIEWITLQQAVNDANEAKIAAGEGPLTYHEAVDFQELLATVTVDTKLEESIDQMMYGLRSKGRLFDAKQISNAITNPPDNLPSRARHYVVKTFANTSESAAFNVSWGAIHVELGGDYADFPLDGSCSLAYIADKIGKIFPTQQLNVSHKPVGRENPFEPSAESRLRRIARQFGIRTLDKKMAAIIGGTTAVVGMLAGAASSPGFIYNFVSKIWGPNVSLINQSREGVRETNITATTNPRSEPEQINSLRTFADQCLPDYTRSTSVSVDGRVPGNDVAERITVSVSRYSQDSQRPFQWTYNGIYVSEPDEPGSWVTGYQRNDPRLVHRETFDAVTNCWVGQASQTLRIGAITENSVVDLGNVHVVGCEVTEVDLDQSTMQQLARGTPEIA